jgi:predicted transport protein
MSDVKLFRVTDGAAEELVHRPVKLEKQVQTLIEKHLEVFLHVRFVASEYSTGKTHAGRIDTLGLDENYCPTIIEYKRNSNANVINQGLFYLDWLMDHRGEFELLAMRQFGQETADKIDWTGPRLLCIAEDFSRYDEHAVQQINRNIELLKYAFYPDSDLIMLDLVNAVVATADTDEQPGNAGSASKQYTTQAEHLERADEQLKTLLKAVSDHMTDLGDDVQERFLAWYIAYKRMKNFATVQLQTSRNSLLMWLPLNPDEVELEEGFSADKRNVGHHGTGDLELTIRSTDDLAKAKPLIQKSFEEN